MDDLTDMLKDLAINDATYYELDTATASDAQDYPTHYPKTVTHTSNKNEKDTDNSNGGFEQKLLSNRTLFVVFPTIKPGIYQRIAPIIVAPQTLSMPATKEVLADAALGRAWVNRNGIDRSTPGDICNSVSIEHASSPVMIRIVATS